MPSAAILSRFGVLPAIMPRFVSADIEPADVVTHDEGILGCPDDPLGFGAGWACALALSPPTIESANSETR